MQEREEHVGKEPAGQTGGGGEGKVKGYRGRKEGEGKKEIGETVQACSGLLVSQTRGRYLADQWQSTTCCNCNNCSYPFRIFQYNQITMKSCYNVLYISRRISRI